MAFRVVSIKHSGVFKLVFRTVISHLVEDGRVEHQVIGQRLLADRLQYMMDILLLLLLAPKFLRNLLLGELDGVLIPLIGRPHSKQLLLVVD